ncbi:MAG: cytochrome c3 family protein [bacterium]|nr:MAG: cytochrome c3 family protein [bacterium]
MTEQKSVFERGLWRNTMSYLGIITSAISAVFIAILLLIDLLAAVHSAYMGVLVFFILPVFFMSGFLLIGWGMWEEHKRRRKASVVEVPKFPVFDLNMPRHRVTFIITLGVAVGTALLLTVIAYEAYHFTESLTFCGELCHEVMEPEATALQNSPHARVSCAKCHVGPGAGWYVRSKLAGSRQMIAVLLNTYPKPLPPAIQHLRPARETCEECHWPEKFYGSKLKVRTHFGFDERNTPHDVSFLVRIGGGESTAGEDGSGIHWHMLSEKKVTFEAADPALQTIPVVWEEKEDGTVVEYRLEGYDEADQGGSEGHQDEPRLVDCVVCHNRPTHIYYSPQESMDKALVEEAIDHKLPYIKKLGVEVLVAEYATKEEAFDRIGAKIWEFYRENYPDVASEKETAVQRAVEVIRDIYDKNFFPEMSVSWKEYPDNIGHRIFPGCFRCHDGKHVSEDGQVIRRECVVCHTMPESSPSKHWTEAFPEGEDWETWHPWDLKYQHAEMNCSRCHTGGLPPSRDCRTCHIEKGVADYDETVGMGDFECQDCHLDLQSVQPVMDCTDCHDDIGQLHTEIEDHFEAGCVTCHQPHLWTVRSRETCYECHDDKEDHNPDEMCADCHDFI